MLPPMPGPIRLLLLAAGACTLLLPGPASAGSPAEDLSRAMARLDATLADDQGHARYAFDDDERFDLRLAPIRLEGLRLDEMNVAQKALLDAALARVLSPSGVQKVDTIRSLEREVAELEGGVQGLLMGWLRDPQRYFLALFGKPSTEVPWGMRFDGHHLSLNWTAKPDAPLSVTPLFLGGQPREVPAGLERAGLRVLAAEEDRAVELIAALAEDGDAYAAARRPFEKSSELSRPMLDGGEVDLALGEAPGVPRAELPEAAAACLDALVEVYLANFAAPVAARHRERVAQGRDGLHFAFAATVGEGAPVAAGDRLYYRIQGAGLLIEYDNTAESADHVHVVWRDPERDFGRDLLAEHLAAHHAAH